MLPADRDTLCDSPSEDVGIAPSEPGVSRRTIWVIATMLALIFAGIDYYVPTVMQRDSIPFASAMGFFAGQIAILALYAALGPSNFVVRFSWAIFLMLVMWYCITLGARRLHHRPREEAIMIGVILVESLLLLQIPLAIAKKWRRWRISRDPYGSVPSVKDRQYGIRHLLLAMLLLSVALSPLNLIFPRTDTPLQIDSNIIFSIPALLILESIAIIPVAIPTIGIVFSRVNAILAVFHAVFFGFAISVVELIGLWCIFVAGSLTLPPADKLADALRPICAFNMVQCVTIGIVVWIFRLLGFRLHTRSTGIRLPRLVAAPEAPRAEDV